MHMRRSDCTASLTHFTTLLPNQPYYLVILLCRMLGAATKFAKRKLFHFGINNSIRQSGFQNSAYFHLGHRDASAMGFMVCCKVHDGGGDDDNGDND